MKAGPALLFFVLLAVPVQAAQSGHDLYVAGKYDEALRLGAASNNAADLVFAARAGLAEAGMKPCAACVAQALGFAQRAVAADPDMADAHTILAIAIGQQARRDGLVLARLHNAPARARHELDVALRLEPQNPLALAALGGWNIEVVRAGGVKLAHWLYGASLQAGLGDFAQAFRREPGNVALRYQYALSLSGFDPVTYHSEILGALETAVKSAPQTAYEKIAQARSAELLDLLKRGDKAAYAVQVRKYQGYP
ncbi:MAG TPA: hypothetical protein VIJ72_05115 [Rhizomicrobium sp.]